mmetsp:Transcript_10459/g.30901  ORF Transcript_10459/g.30901 Transcript_10459/m.30901 type:complete len:401 (+) Transcript_10459:576-1778(+)
MRRACASSSTRPRRSRSFSMSSSSSPTTSSSWPRPTRPRERSPSRTRGATRVTRSCCASRTSRGWCHCRRARRQAPLLTPHPSPPHLLTSSPLTSLPALWAASLQEALREREAEVEEAEARQAGRVLLSEALQTAEVRRTADAEMVHAATLRAQAAEQRAVNATERNEHLKAELTRREARSAALRKSLAAAEGELALLRSSKELLAARFELQHEISRQRGLTATEDSAVAAAIASTKGRQAHATDSLVRAAGQHAAAAVGAAQQASQQVSAHEARSDAQWASSMVELEASQRTDELSEGLGRARDELQRQQERAAALQTQLQAARDDTAAATQATSSSLSQSFHNTCLLVKLLLSTRQLPATVLVQELYDEVQQKGVPVEEWPTYVHARMSGGQPISTWF